MLLIFTYFLLIQVDFTSKPTYWKALYPPIKAKLGELLVSLTYHPAKNTLTIFVMKAKNLKAKDINGKSGIELKHYRTIIRNSMKIILDKVLD